MALAPSTPLPDRPSPDRPETIQVDRSVDQVMCDGGMGPLGHPAVYYSFDGRSQVECLYCDRVFRKT